MTHIDDNTHTQNQLNCLWRSAQKHGLKVNLKKSDIVVFRKGGFLSKREKWFYGDREMKVVGRYNYLGLYFSSKLSFSTAVQNLCGKAKHVVVHVLSTLYRLENNSEIFLKLFVVVRKLSFACFTLLVKNIENERIQVTKEGV